MTMERSMCPIWAREVLMRKIYRSRFFGGLAFRIGRRIRFRKVCKAIGIKPYPWQRKFALSERELPPLPSAGRATGKTMAVMLRILSYQPYGCRDAALLFSMDPDFRREPCRMAWYLAEYKRLSTLCVAAGMDVLILVRRPEKYYLVAHSNNRFSPNIY